MAKTIGHFLRDTRNDLLWLHEDQTDTSFEIPGIVDFARCEQVDAEMVASLYLGYSPSSSEVIVAKDPKEHYGVFSLFTDTLGFGGVYCSIFPGFSFKKVFGFANDVDLYVVAEDLEDQWGMIRITMRECYWKIRGLVFPNIIVRFNCKSKEEVLDCYPLHTEPANPFFRHNELIDLTNLSNSDNKLADDGMAWGTTLAAIQNSRRSTPTRKWRRFPKP